MFLKELNCQRNQEREKNEKHECSRLKMTLEHQYYKSDKYTVFREGILLNAQFICGHKEK